jgi:hypothetical protein
LMFSVTLLSFGCERFKYQKKPRRIMRKPPICVLHWSILDSFDANPGGSEEVREIDSFLEQFCCVHGLLKVQIFPFVTCPESNYILSKSILIHESWAWWMKTHTCIRWILW